MKSQVCWNFRWLRRDRSASHYIRRQEFGVDPTFAHGLRIKLQVCRGESGLAKEPKLPMNVVKALGCRYSGWMASGPKGLRPNRILVHPIQES